MSDGRNIDFGGFRVPSADEFIEMAEKHGIVGMNDEIVDIISEELTFMMAAVVEDSLKFMNKSNHLSLDVEDVEKAMRMRGIMPPLGITPEHFTDDKVVHLKDVIRDPLPPVPLKCSLRPHWLAIDGVQPAIPENPTKRNQSSCNITDNQLAKPKAVQDFSKKKSKSKSKAKLKTDFLEHELTLEQQIFFSKITDACVTAERENEQHQKQALETLKTDAALAKMLPRFVSFITEGVKFNVACVNMPVLIYLMKMCEALVKNENVYLEAYLHDLVPSVITCILCRQLCRDPGSHDHWSFRNYSARLLNQICKKFSTCANQLQSRIVKTMESALDNSSVPPTLYGAIYFLSEIGAEPLNVFTFPRIKRISNMLSNITQHDVDKQAAQKIGSLFSRILLPLIRQIRKPPHIIEDFIKDYGHYLGKLLHGEMIELLPPQQRLQHSRQLQQHQSTNASSTIINRTPPKFKDFQARSVNTQKCQVVQNSPDIGATLPSRSSVMSELNNAHTLLPGGGPTHSPDIRGLPDESEAIVSVTSPCLSESSMDENENIDDNENADDMFAMLLKYG